MNFKSLPQMLDYFKDEETCIKYYEQMRWKGNPVCPHCKAEKPYKTNRGYKCSSSDCYKKFTVKVGTIFHNSKIPMRTWFVALFLTTHKKGISSVQLAVDIGVTQATAWFMLHRLRKMYKAKVEEQLGKDKVVEIDETHIGGKEKNRHWKKRRSKVNEELARDGTIYNKKKVVVGIIERSGQVVLKYFPNPQAKSISPFIQETVKNGSDIMTDESVLYYSYKTTALGGG
jgi:transposase-like protein